jgi:hypothetical protein
MRMFGGDGIGADFDLLDGVDVEIVGLLDFQNAVDGGMQVAAARIGLEVAARDGERRSRLAGLARQLELAIGRRVGGEEAILGLEHVDRAGHAALRQQHGEQSFPRRVARVQAFDFASAVQEREQAGG